MFGICSTIKPIKMIKYSLTIGTFPSISTIFVFSIIESLSPQIILLVNQFQRTKLLESLWCRRPKEEAGFSGLFPAGMDHKTSPWESTFAQSLRMTLSVVMVWIYGLSKNIRDHENMIFNFHLIWKDHPPACHRRKLPRLLPRWKWGSQSHRRSKPSWFSPLWFLGKMKMLWNWSESKYEISFKWVLWNWKLKFVKVKVAYRTMGRWWWHQLCRRCSWKSQTFPSLTLEPTCKGFFHVYFQTAALSFETWFEVCLPHLLVSGLREGKHGDWRRPCTSLNIFARLKQEDFKSCITLGHT